MTDWDAAVCSPERNEVDPDLFHVEADELRALMVCGRCPIQVDCLEATRALEHSVGRQEGVWGGTTEADRKALWHLDTYEVQRIRAGIY